MLRRTLRILWPAFLVAGVLEMMVFAVVDPADMRWFGGPHPLRFRIALLAEDGATPRAEIREKSTFIVPR